MPPSGFRQDIASFRKVAAPIGNGITTLSHFPASCFGTIFLTSPKIGIIFDSALFILMFSSISLYAEGLSSTAKAFAIFEFFAKTIGKGPTPANNAPMTSPSSINSEILFLSVLRRGEKKTFPSEILKVQPCSL